ncbi:hypothetical protein [Cribrihabitans neustonicus]|uniref:hypothetical protein n=1 Tax=Cribrihabitans neustonicus TaxID=1429085 RepID=UPI003B5C82DA
MIIAIGTSRSIAHQNPFGRMQTQFPGSAADSSARACSDAEIRRRFCRTPVCIDIAVKLSYREWMQKFAHILAIMFLALFAAGSVVHAVSANSMALDMAAAAGEADVMPDCQGCEAGDADTVDAGSCDLDCTTPGIAALDTAPGPLFVMVPARQNRLLGMSLPSGRRGAPDPSPPRTLI